MQILAHVEVVMENLQKLHRGPKIARGIKPSFYDDQRVQKHLWSYFNSMI